MKNNNLCTILSKNLKGKGKLGKILKSSGRGFPLSLAVHILGEFSAQVIFPVFVSSVITLDT